MLRTQPGIYSIKVALLAERGVVEYDPNVWEPDKIISVSLLSPPTPALSISCRAVSEASEAEHPLTTRPAYDCVCRCAYRRPLLRAYYMT